MDLRKRKFGYSGILTRRSNKDEKTKNGRESERYAVGGSRNDASSFWRKAGEEVQGCRGFGGKRRAGGRLVGSKNEGALVRINLARTEEGCVTKRRGSTFWGSQSWYGLENLYVGRQPVIVAGVQPMRHGAANP
jgi:hypothetical protein